MAEKHRSATHEPVNKPFAHLTKQEIADHPIVQWTAEFLIEMTRRMQERERQAYIEPPQAAPQCRTTARRRKAT